MKTIQGYVVGQPIATSTVIKSNFSNNYPFILADISSEINTANMIYVQIPSAFRSSYGLYSNFSFDFFHLFNCVQAHVIMMKLN